MKYIPVGVDVISTMEVLQTVGRSYKHYVAKIAVHYRNLYCGSARNLNVTRFDE